MSLRKPSRSAMERFLFTPPGMAPVPWIFLPAVALMISWPYFAHHHALHREVAETSVRDADDVAGCAGSASKPKSRSGETRWKKCSAWDWKIWP